MKRLLVLFILFPVILFGQMRRGAIVDSIKADTTNLKHISELISNKQGTWVEHIHVSDTGEYVTMVVRVRVTEPIVITALPLPSAIKMKTGDIVTGMVSAVAVLPLPAHVIEGATIDAVPVLAIGLFKIEDIVVRKLRTVAVPRLPILRDTILDLPPLAVVKLAEDVSVIKMNTAAVPPLPYVFMTEGLPLVSVTPIGIKDIVFAKVRTATVPELPYVTGVEMPLLGAVELPIVIHPHHKMDTVTAYSFEEKRMPVAGMHLSDEGYSLLEKLEGFSPMPYALGDGGLTIGFGFFVPYGEENMWKKGVTWEEAERMIREKVPGYEDQVKRYINVPLTQREFDALTMLAYNLGGFSKATSIVNDINAQADFDKLQSDWKRFVHSKAPGVTKGLMNRRRDELQVRNESNYQAERKIQVLKNIK